MQHNDYIPNWHETVCGWFGQKMRTLTTTKQFVGGLGNRWEVHEGWGVWNTQGDIWWWVVDGVVWLRGESKGDEEEGVEAVVGEYSIGLWLGCYNHHGGKSARELGWYSGWGCKEAKISLWVLNLTCSWGCWVPNRRERWGGWWTRTLWASVDMRWRWKWWHNWMDTSTFWVWFAEVPGLEGSWYGYYLMWRNRWERP